MTDRLKLLPVFDRLEPTRANYVGSVETGVVPIQPKSGLNLVSRVRIELTTRGFSIQDTKNTESSEKHADSSHVSRRCAQVFYLGLTRLARSADLRGLSPDAAERGLRGVRAVAKTRAPYVARRRGAS